MILTVVIVFHYPELIKLQLERNVLYQLLQIFVLASTFTNNL